jgi:hypothetical protein
MKRCFISPILRPFVPGAEVSAISNCVPASNRYIRISSLLKSEKILIFGSSKDLTVTKLLDYAHSKGVPATLIPVEELGWRYVIDWDPSARFDVRKRFGIYHRIPGTRDPRLAKLFAILNSMLAHLDGNIVNRPSRRTTNHSKPLQMAVINKLKADLVYGIPTQLINGWPKNHFAEGRTVIKSISSMRSQAVTLSDRRLADKVNIRFCPVQLQPQLYGDNIRVHVCGDVIIAIKLKTKLLDYRFYDGITCELIRIPESVSRWCWQITQAEGLELSGIDLIRTYHPERYFFLEINPSPGYYYFEELMVNAGNPPLISEWLLSRLIK